MQFIGVIHADTPRAYFFQDWFWHEPEWMPKSQSEVLRSDDTDEVILTASIWISKQKLLKEFTERKPQDAK